MVVGNTKEKGRETVAKASERGRENKQHQEYTGDKIVTSGALVYKVESCASTVNIFSWSDSKQTNNNKKKKR